MPEGEPREMDVGMGAGGRGHGNVLQVWAAAHSIFGI